MNSDSFFEKFYLFVIRNYRIYCCKKSYLHYFKLLKRHGIEKKKLSSAQKKQIDAIWGRLGRYDYNTHIMAYSVTGEFNPEIMPELLFRTKIELAMNNQLFKNSWADKAYFNFHFPKELFPKTIVSNINDVFYDEDYNVLTKDEAIRLITSNSEFVVKPSLESGLGHGIARFENTDNIEEILHSYKKNFVVQQVFKQHQMISEFNPSSVNVVRYISIFINGKVVPIMAALRCGAEGSFNDNSVTADGLGMFIIGIDDKGILRDKAYHSCGKHIVQCPNGTEFAGKTVPGFEKMKEIITNLHSKMAHFCFMSWDFTVDKSGNPKIMEYNIKGAGVLYYQYANGPLLGDCTQEIINWLENERER